MGKQQELTGKHPAAHPRRHLGMDGIKSWFIFLCAALHVFDFRIPKNVTFLKKRGEFGDLEVEFVM